MAKTFSKSLHNYVHSYTFTAIKTSLLKMYGKMKFATNAAVVGNVQM